MATALFFILARVMFNLSALATPPTINHNASESVSNSVKENDVEHGGMASYLNRPIAFTLGAEVRKAAYTIHNFTKE